jgi:hypothetical protein
MPHPYHGDAEDRITEALAQLINILDHHYHDAYSPEQERDYHGRWGSGGGSQIDTPAFVRRVVRAAVLFQR